MIRRPPRSTLFPYTRSSDLNPVEQIPLGPKRGLGALALGDVTDDRLGDRKSTRLNSSHSQISYAVFCLKKKSTRIGAHTSTHWRCTARTPAPALYDSLVHQP